MPIDDAADKDQKSTAAEVEEMPQPAAGDKPVGNVLPPTIATPTPKPPLGPLSPQPSVDALRPKTQPSEDLASGALVTEDARDRQVLQLRIAIGAAAVIAIVLLPSPIWAIPVSGSYSSLIDSQIPCCSMWSRRSAV